MHRRAFLATLSLPVVPLPVLALAGCARSQARVEGPAAHLLAAAGAQMLQTHAYDPAYTRLAYPGGDVPASKGVCTDVVIRAYRGIGIDLQKLVHEDMSAHFDLYPKTWGLKAPDSNIDHRRVPNLRVFFARFGKVLPVSRDPGAYQPGDIITNRPSGPHIALVSDIISPVSGHLMVYQNIGWGARLDDQLLSYEMTGHYRYAV